MGNSFLLLRAGSVMWSSWDTVSSYASSSALQGVPREVRGPEGSRPEGWNGPNEVQNCLPGSGTESAPPSTQARAKPAVVVRVTAGLDPWVEQVRKRNKQNPSKPKNPKCSDNNSREAGKSGRDGWRDDRPQDR